MRVRDMGLAILTSVIWGFAFVTYRFALESFSPAQLTVLRFVFACLPVVFVPRPKLSWGMIALIGFVLLGGQFILLMTSYALGMPAGLGSALHQTQVVFTVALAAILMREVPTAREGLGIVVAFAGLVLIALTVGGDLKPAALAFTVAAATSWAIGNMLLKRTGDTPVFPLMVWASLVAPWPALAYSYAIDPQPSLWLALTHASWLSLAVAFYLGVPATLVAYGAWSYLLQRYPAATVAPFALLSPATGILCSALVNGERFAPLRLAGVALILAGLAVIVWPARRVTPSIPSVSAVAEPRRRNTAARPRS
jgi:O-acetylserine/cysteine efflux transporter